jgi:hypothetical protein
MYGIFAIKRLAVSIEAIVFIELCTILRMLPNCLSFFHYKQKSKCRLRLAMLLFDILHKYYHTSACF